MCWISLDLFTHGFKNPFITSTTRFYVLRARVVCGALAAVAFDGAVKMKSRQHFGAFNGIN